MSRRWDKMPHETVWERHGAVVRFWGRLTGRELADAADDIASDPRLDGLRLVITDLLALESHAVDAASMERVAITRLGSRQTNPNVRLLVVTTDPAFLALVASARKASLWAPTSRTPSTPWLTHAPGMSSSLRSTVCGARG